MSTVTDRYARSSAPPSKPVFVAMVEDDCACRLAVVQAVQSSTGLQMLWAAASRQEALSLLQGGSKAEGKERLLGAQSGVQSTVPSDAPSPDVLLVDLGLPDGSGLDVIAAARACLPDCAVMVSTIFGDETHVLRAIEAGAMGYLLKDLSAEELVAEIRSLHAGGSPINPMVARKLLMRQVAQSVKPQEPALEAAVPPSAREAEVLRLVARGYTVDEVAGALGVSPHTVQTFVRRIYTKLQVNSRAGAVREGARQGWLREE